MKEIKLTQGQVAKVCDCHAHLVEGHNWAAHFSVFTKSFYAERHASVVERLLGLPSKIKMHAVVNDTPRGFKTDHKNRDTLDNRCSNLRTATNSQNQANQGKRTDNTSGYRGIFWQIRLKKWKAQICIHGKIIYLGLFVMAEDAARAYDRAAIEHQGEFAVTNFPRSDYL